MSPSSPTLLEGTVSAIPIHKFGYGLMMLTWSPEGIPDEQAFDAIKTSIDLTPKDRKLLLNSAEFYGWNPRTANLELLSRFFTKYPELADRVFLSVKGGRAAGSFEPDCSPENLRLGVETTLKILDGKKKVDLYQCGRVDPKIPIEDTIATLVELAGEGKFDHIGVSEVSAATLKRANAVHPIAAVEIEVSPWAYEDETKKVITTAQELGIPIIAYSPLGRGFITDNFSPPAGDFRPTYFAKFQGEAGEHNKKVVEALGKIAEKKGITTAQLSLAWVSALGPHIVPIPGTSKAARIKENFAAVDVEFTAEELKEINDVLETQRFVGPRGRGVPEEGLWG